MFGAVRSQLHVVDLASGECRQLTDGAEHAGAPAWSPDGTTIAFTRAVGDDSDLRFRTAVHLLDVDDPKALPRVVAFADGVAGTVSYSADGESLLVVGWPGDPVGHARLFRVPLDGGAPVDLTGSLDRNVMPGAPAYPGALPQEAADGRILFCLRDRGCTHLWSVAADGRTPGLCSTAPAGSSPGSRSPATWRWSPSPRRRRTARSSVVDLAAATRPW